MQSVSDEVATERHTPCGQYLPITIFSQFVLHVSNVVFTLSECHLFTVLVMDVQGGPKLNHYRIINKLY